VPLPLVPEAGLPEVPLSPLDELAPLLPPVPEVLPVPEPLIEAEELELPGVDGDDDEAELGEVLSLLLLEVLDGAVVLAVLEGVLDELDDVLPVPACLSQPATAAPARARTATTGMSFFMTSPI
jgi:hypothetical protein